MQARRQLRVFLVSKQALPLAILAKDARRPAVSHADRRLIRGLLEKILKLRMYRHHYSLNETSQASSGWALRRGPSGDRRRLPSGPVEEVPTALIQPSQWRELMDKLVRRVTIVRGSGENRQTEVVYKSGDDEDADL